MVPKLTASGKNLLLRALAGETITFTKIQLGNGTAQDPAEATGLANPIITVELSKIVVGTEYVTLTAQFSNSSITSGFHITEAGFFAKDPDDSTKEILYALGNEDESSADYVPDKNNRILEMQFDAVIFIGDAENVSAAISSSLVYAAKEDFDAHTADKTNPHGVTKQQVGLGNVPNLAPSDQAPTFTDATVFSNIESGEKTSVLFGKIKLAISKLIDHLNNRSNPHNTTAAQVGAAAKNHTHNAQDINAGTLPIQRGGTGFNNISDFATALCSGGSLTRTVVGSYFGKGIYRANYANSITFENEPKLLIVMPETNSETCRSGGFIAIRGVKTILFGGLMNDVYYQQTTQDTQLHFTWSGNSVSWYSESSPYMQRNAINRKYIYIAVF